MGELGGVRLGRCGAEQVVVEGKVIGLRGWGWVLMMGA